MSKPGQKQEILQKKTYREGGALLPILPKQLDKIKAHKILKKLRAPDLTIIVPSPAK